MPTTIQDPETLTSEQQDILVAAMNDRGQFAILQRSDTFGKAVRTKKVRFFDADDPEVARKYLDAVKQLEQLLLVREIGKRDHFELTNVGWLMGRKVQQAQKRR